MLVGRVDRIGPASHLNYEERLAPIWFAGVRVVHCNDASAKHVASTDSNRWVFKALWSGRSIGLDPTTRAEIGSSGAKLQRPKAPISIRPSSVHGRTWDVWTYRVAWLQRLHVMNISPPKAAANLLVNHPETGHQEIKHTLLFAKRTGRTPAERAEKAWRFLKLSAKGCMRELVRPRANLENS